MIRPAICGHLPSFLGRIAPVSDIKTIDVQEFRKKLIKAGKNPHTVNNYLSAVKAMYNWAINNEVIGLVPNLRAVRKITAHKHERPIFTAKQIHDLLTHANCKMRAMIWLGLNCGFGCTDCSELRWEHLDLKKGRVDFPRGKTGIRRNLVLWEESVAALKVLPKTTGRVFNTEDGNAYVRVDSKLCENGTTKLLNYDAVGRNFTRLLKKAGIKTEKGVGFYTLRRTAATLAARSGDPFAVQKLLGHADLKMATTYVQDVSEQTDRVINNTRKFIVQDDS
jgi:integrase